VRQAAGVAIASTMTPQARIAWRSSGGNNTNLAPVPTTRMSGTGSAARKGARAPRSSSPGVAAASGSTRSGKTRTDPWYRTPETVNPPAR
jgi:hypothetical protein